MARRKDTIKNNHRESYLYTRRVIVLIVLVTLACIALAARLFLLQVVDQRLYVTLSNQNQLSLIPIEPNRGLILDRNGVLLAENVPIFNLVVTPDRVPNLQDTINKIKTIVDITP